MDMDEFESFQSADFEANTMNDQEKKTISSPKLGDPYADMILAAYLRT